MAKKEKQINCNIYDFGNKQDCVDRYVRYMLNRTNQMFEYNGLPDTINVRQLELKNQINGYTIWLKIEDDEIVQYPESRELKGGIYALHGGIGGVIDLNEEPSYAIVAHPRLKQSKKLKIGEECVLMRNDGLMMGLLPLYEKYATQLMENDITMNLADIESRIVALITAGDDRSKASADQFIIDIVNGKLSVVGDKSFMDNMKLNTLPYVGNANSTITNLIELQQYIKASWYNEIGLSANYNMKRESINSGEAQLGRDSLLPLIDDMLHERQLAVEEVNRIFGTNISVDFHSAWAHVQEDVIMDAVPDEEEIVQGTGKSPVLDIAEGEKEPESEEKDEGEDTTDKQEDYNRNLQKRAKRGNM